MKRAGGRRPAARESVDCLPASRRPRAALHQRMDQRAVPTPDVHNRAHVVASTAHEFADELAQSERKRGRQEG